MSRCLDALDSIIIAYRFVQDIITSASLVWSSDSLALQCIRIKSTERCFLFYHDAIALHLNLLATQRRRNRGHWGHVLPNILQ